jgi:hypothetical protein
MIESIPNVCGSALVLVSVTMSASRRRGSRRRVKQIRFREHWSRDMSFLFGAVVLLIVLFFWLSTRGGH